jgi:hypothetical protein
LNDNKPSFTVRPAKIEEYDVLIDLFNRVFKKEKDKGTLEWKYLKNPHGPSIVWVAESLQGDMVGSLAFVPRRICIQGKEHLTLLAADGMVFKEWQRHGIFVRLLEIMFEKSWALEAPLVIAFSGRRSIKGLLRTDWDEVGLVQEWVLPLRGRYWLKGIIRRLPFLSGPVSALGDFLLGQGRLRGFMKRNLATEVRKVERFDEDLAQAGMKALKERPLFLVRDQAFLNWRYVDNPTGRHQCFGAYRDSEPKGYLVMETAGGRSYIIDLVALDSLAREDLLAFAVLEGRRTGAEMLHCMALEGDEVDMLLRAWGFKCLPREGLLPFMIKTKPDQEPLKQVVTRSRLWYLSHGDKDAEHMTL